MRDFLETTSLVTGGASGIGRCIALALAGEGSSVVLVDLDEAGLERVKAEVEAVGVEASVHCLDVTDADAVNALAQVVRPNILVNCAGIALLADAESTSPQQWDRILDVNLRGPINMCSAFLPSLKERGGHIVNVASVDGLIAFPGSAAYATSKFGLVGFSESIGIELAKYGIGVTAVCPGFTWTPMVDTISIGGFSRQKVDRLLRILKPVIFTTPERLAAATIKAVKRNKPLLAHTPVARFAYLVKRLSPRLYRDLFGAPIYKVVKSLSE
ncbi:MAG: SDR family NAD(P)-dependent oxidoreductase [Candidatus Geothermincolia bacterium]